MRYSSGIFVLSPTNGDMAGNVTATAVQDGAGDLRNKRFVGIVATFTGAPVGSLALQLSADGVEYNTVGSAVAVSAAGKTAWDITDTGFFWARVVYTRTSGTGTLSVKFSAKGD